MFPFLVFPILLMDYILALDPSALVIQKVTLTIVLLSLLSCLTFDPLSLQFSYCTILTFSHIIVQRYLTSRLTYCYRILLLLVLLLPP